MKELAGTLGAKIGRLALWLMPLTIVFEWVGGTFYKTLPMRLAYLGLFLGLFWLADVATEPAPSSRQELGRLRRPLGVLLLALGMATFAYACRWLLAARMGWSPLEPPAWLGEERNRLLLPIVAAWPLALGARYLRAPEFGARSYEQLGSFVALAFLLHIAAGVRVQSLPLLAHDESAFLLPGLALVLLALSVTTKGNTQLRLGLLLAAGFVLRTRGIASWQIDPRVRDMLALVESAQDRFAAGHNPYAFYAMQRGSELPLTYFPGLWLGYGIPRLFGLDLRIMGAVAEAVMLWSVGLLARRSDPARRPWAEAFVGCFAAVWLFSPSIQWNVIYAEPALWWALLGLLFAFAFSGRLLVGALVLGVAIATRHFAIVLAPFVVLYFLRARGLRAGLPYLALAGGVALLLLAPFVLADPELFWFGTFRWLREYGPAHISWFFDRFGFLQLFSEHDALDRMPLVQSGVVLLCLLGAACSKQPARVASYAATALLLFVMLNVLLWDSFLIDGAVAALGVVIARAARVGTTSAATVPASESTPPIEGELASAAPVAVRSHSARVLYASYAALAALGIFGAYFAFTLVRSQRPSGRARAHDYMVSAVKPGDFVIDRSDRRIAFVQGSWLLRRDEVPAPIGGELYDAAWGGGAALGASGRIWLVTQTDRDRELRSSFARLGRPVEDRTLGDYRAQAVQPARPRAAIPATLLSGAEKRPCQVGWTNAEMLGVMLQPATPTTITFARPAAPASALLALGFHNLDVAWPRKDVQARVLDSAHDSTFELRNLIGVQFRSFAREELPNADLRVELTSADPNPRLVCMQLLWLP